MTRTGGSRRWPAGLGSLTAPQRVLALRERQREVARQRRLDERAKNPQAAWAQARKLIGTKVPARCDEAVTLLADLRELARRDGEAGEFKGARRPCAGSTCARPA